VSSDVAEQWEEECDVQVGGWPRALRDAISKLADKPRAAVLNYLEGPDGVRGNKTESYVRAGYNGKNRNSSSAAASKFFSGKHVAHILALYNQLRESIAERRFENWEQLYPIAVQAVGDALVGTRDPDNPRQRKISRMMMDAANMVIDRVEGRPKQAVEVSGNVSVTPLLLDLADEEGDNG